MNNHIFLTGMMMILSVSGACTPNDPQQEQQYDPQEQNGGASPQQGRGRSGKTNSFHLMSADFNMAKTTFELPEGWRSQGSSRLDMNYGGSVSQWSIEQLSGRISINVPGQRSFLYNAQMAQFMGQSYPVPQYTGPQQMAYNLLGSNTGQAFSHPLADRLLSTLRQKYPGVSVEYAMYRTGPDRFFLVYCNTQQVSGSAYSWSYVPLYIQCNENELEKAFDALHTAYRTVRINDDYQQQELQYIAAYYKNANSQLQQIGSSYSRMNRAMQGYTDNSSINRNDGHSQRFSDVLLDRTRKSDANGNEYILDNRYNNHYLDQNSNTIIQTDRNLNNQYGLEELD